MKAGEEVERLMTRDPPLPHRAWRRMRGRYLEVVDHDPLSPSPIDESIPIEEEVEWAVRILRGNRSGGPSHMRAKHLREWLWEHRSAEAMTKLEMEAVGETSGPYGRERATTEEGMTDGGEERETTKLEKVVELVQLAF